MFTAEIVLYDLIVAKILKSQSIPKQQSLFSAQYGYISPSTLCSIVAQLSQQHNFLHISKEGTSCNMRKDSDERSGKNLWDTIPNGQQVNGRRIYGGGVHPHPPPFTIFFDFRLRSLRYEKDFLPVLSKYQNFQMSGKWFPWYPKGGVYTPP